ncbi:MAG: CehA/McbA family metallohydrolase [Bacillota bacterium]
MIIDMHLHTSAMSSCSKLDPEEAVRYANEIGIDAICFTEHGRLWPESDLERLSVKWGIPVFGGMEVETREGHMLVFGLSEDIPGVIPASELRDMVDQAGGVMVYAHPFRGFLLFGFTDLQLTIKEASGRPLFKMVDAVEVLSGKSTKKENNLALEVCNIVSLPGLGGSDAHSPGEIGRCATVFDTQIGNTKELVEAMKTGSYRAVYHGK